MRDLLAIIDGPVLDPFMGSSPIGEACAELGLPTSASRPIRATSTPPAGGSRRSPSAARRGLTRSGFDPLNPLSGRANYYTS